MGDKSKKSGRTPEQQAARDARKAAKKAAAAAAQAEEQAEVAPTETVDDDMTEEAADAPASRKRKQHDELEIDLSVSAPLSKAEARAARKRAKRGEEPLPAKKSAGEGDKPKRKRSDSDSEGEDGKEKAPKQKQKRSEWSIWIGNLSFRTTPEGLTAWIDKGLVDQGGEAGCVTRVNLPKKPGRGTFAENKGFAYVDFATEAAQLLAIGLSEGFLDGRRLLIKAGSDHSAKPDARTPKPVTAIAPGTSHMAAQLLAKAREKHAESSTVFIGNLPFDTTEEELRDLVERNAPEIVAQQGEGEGEGEGEGGDDEEKEEKEEDEQDGEGETEEDAKAAAPVTSRSGIKSGLIKTRLAQFEDTGRCKGFAFWDFKSTAHAAAAVQIRANHFLRGHRLNLQFSSAEAAQRSGGRRGDKAGRGAARGGRGGRGGARGRPARYFDAPEGGDEGEGDGGYGGRGYGRGGYGQDGAGQGAGESESAAASRIARDLVSGGGDDAPAGGRNDKRGKKWESTGRPRPGAALAMARREKTGIVESVGTKISFD